jgi:hypothetical protein
MRAWIDLAGDGMIAIIWVGIWRGSTVMVQPHGYVITPAWTGVAFAASTPSGGVNFRVDPDNAEQFIKDMEEVLKRLDKIDRTARQLEVAAPGNENFSEVAAAAFNKFNNDGARGHLVANQKARAA